MFTKTPPNRLSRRVFLVDAVCASELGHNANSLLHFSRLIEADGHSTQILVSLRFNASDARYAHFRPAFQYLYPTRVPLDRPTPEEAGLGDFIEALSRMGAGVAIDRHLETLAITDWLRLFREYGISSEDIIFFPSADFVAVSGLVSAMKLLPQKTRPNIHLRFIGVMELTGFGPRDCLRALARRLRDLEREKLFLSAETPALAARLSGLTGLKVDLVLYPLGTPHHSPQPDGPFVVTSIGGGRWDKGFFRLFDIIRETFRRLPPGAAQFRIQNLQPSAEMAAADYCAQLRALPDLQILSSTQSSEEIDRQFRESSLVLMPYDPAIYRFRGSAVFMEAIACSRPVVLSKGTGFDVLAKKMPSVSLATDNVAFAEAIRSALDTPALDRAAAALESHRIYERETGSGIATLRAQFRRPAADRAFRESE